MPAANKCVPRGLLTDLLLPDGHDVELIGETRERFTDIEIMAISALGNQEAERKQKGSGGDAVRNQFGTSGEAVRDR